MALRRYIEIALVGLAVLIAAPAAAPGAVVQSGFQESVELSGLGLPVAFDFAPDGRIFVAEKHGMVRVFDNLDDTSSTQFANLRGKVFSFLDRGLLGLAVDPGFPARPYVYVLYTYDAEIGGTAPKWGTSNGFEDNCPSPPGSSTDGCVVSGRLSRLVWENGAMVAEQVLIEDWCQQFSSHSIGDLEFGPDGALYVSGGDGASFGNVDYGQFGHVAFGGGNPCGDPPVGVGGVQAVPGAEGGALRSQDILTPADPTGLDGTIIRIDPDTGEGLPGNPLYASLDQNERRIVAYGLRNPFRFAIGAETNEVYSGEVGWNDFEEINRFNPTAGTLYNSGWPCYEGSGRQQGYEGLGLSICQHLYDNPGVASPPFFSYEHHHGISADDECTREGPEYRGSAIAGLTVYDGDSFPASYEGALFFADSVRRCIWVMFAGEDGRPDPSTVATFVDSQAKTYPGLDIEVGPGGDLFYLSMFDDEATGGTLRRIRYFSDNQPPVARLSVDKQWSAGDLTAEFDTGESSDADHDELVYEWDLEGKGSFSAPGTEAKKTKNFTGSKNHTVAVRVSDPDGATSVARVTVYPNNTPPEPQILGPDPGSFEWGVGDQIEFAGSAGDEEDGELPATSLDWSALLYHCPDSCHEHLMQAFPSVAAGSFTGPEHEYPSHIGLTLRAVDSRGLAASRTVDLHPRTVDLDISANKPGLILSAGPISKPAPFALRAIAGSNIGLVAPEAQELGGKLHTWQGWLHGGDRIQTVSADDDASYEAIYGWTPDPDPPPGPPQLLSTHPASPANHNMPKVLGTAPAGTTVDLYAAANCAGAPLVAARPAADLEAGIEIAVADSSTTTFSAIATSGGGDSVCSNSLVYLEDSIPPMAQVDTGPGGLTDNASPTFTFSSEQGATFQCSIDIGAPSFGSCSGADSHAPAAPLGDGPYTFRVRATDQAGNSATATRGFVVDATAPQVQVDSLSKSLLRAGETSELSWGADENGTFVLRVGGTNCDQGTVIDTGPYSSSPGPRTSDVATADLPEGESALRLCLTDSAGNRGLATAMIVRDTVPPDTQITAHPTVHTSATSASFAFVGSDPDGSGVAGFQCRLGSSSDEPGAWSACASPRDYSDLAEDEHRFEVQAIDAATNADGSPAGFEWEVDIAASGPDPDSRDDPGPGSVLDLTPSLEPLVAVSDELGVRLVGRPGKRTASSMARFRFAADFPGARFRCELDASPVRFCRSPKIYTGLKPGKHTFAVVAVDMPGGRVSFPATFRWRILCRRPRAAGGDDERRYSAATSVCQAGRIGRS